MGDRRSLSARSSGWALGLDFDDGLDLDGHAVGEGGDADGGTRVLGAIAEELDEQV